jgi:hypothetical protein
VLHKSEIKKRHNDNLQFLKKLVGILEMAMWELKDGA